MHSATLLSVDWQGHFSFFFCSLEKIIRSFCSWKSMVCAVSMELTKLLKLNDLCGHCCFSGDALNSSRVTCYKQ